MKFQANINFHHFFIFFLIDWNCIDLWCSSPLCPSVTWPRPITRDQYQATFLWWNWNLAAWKFTCQLYETGKSRNFFWKVWILLGTICLTQDLWLRNHFYVWSFGLKFMSWQSKTLGDIVTLCNVTFSILHT